jgi:hypothetical protein
MDVNHGEKQLKVYIAGKLTDYNIPFIIKIIKESGIHITHDWTKCIGDEKSKAAKQDIQGVIECDILVALMIDPDYEYRGTFLEIGIAIGSNKKILIISSGGKCENLCFFHYEKIIHSYLYNIHNTLRILNAIKSNPNQNKKILIIGPGKHGKDTFTEMIVKETNLQFQSSSQYANELIVFDALKDKYNYKNSIECFNDRSNHRLEWYDLICEYNKDDKSRLTKEILEKNDIYVGMRDDKEFDESCHLFDIVIWIRSRERNIELIGENNIKYYVKARDLKDPSMKIVELYADIIIENDGSIDDLYIKAKNLINFFNLY